MKYENANNVLPPNLVSEIQKYAAGRLLYIPQKEEPMAWGSLSGTRQKLRKRNQRIYDEYRNGKGVGELSEQYFLSVDSIRKIVYGTSQSRLSFLPTLENALQYNQAGLAEEWLRICYMKKLYGEQPYPEEWICDGLINMPLRLIDDVDNGTLRQSENMPLIICFRKGRFCYQGSRGFFTSLKNRHVAAYPAYVFVPDKQEYDRYVFHYGRHFHCIRFRDGYGEDKSYAHYKKEH